MNYLQPGVTTGRKYLELLTHFLKRNKVSKKYVVVSVVPSSLTTQNVIAALQASKLKNSIKLVSICPVINLNNIKLTEHGQIVKNLMSYC